ncbi:MAG TPA: AI-2E family transporter [Bauldia sp.]
MASGENPPSLSPAFPASVRVGIVGIFLIMAVGALYYARSFFLPLVLASLLTLALAPLVRMLANRGIPAAVSAGLLVLLMALTLAVASYTLSDPLTRLLSQAPATITAIGQRFAFLRQPFAMLNDASHQFERLTGGEPATPQSVVIAQPGLLTWVAGTAAGIGTTLGAALILSLFLLANRDTLRIKLVRVVPHLSDKKRSLRVLRDIENEVSRYLLTITAINLGLGFCVGAAMAFLGMPNAVLWGIGAALLNYIPFLGALAGQCLALAVAAVTFPTLTLAILPPLAYLAIQLIEANFVTPTVLGRRLELNPVAILIFLALTTWMWGIVGTILGVPILVVVKVFADNFPALASFGEFLSTEAATEEDEATAAAATAAPLPPPDLQLATVVAAKETPP